METPSPDRDLSEAQVETTNQSNETLHIVDTVIHETLGGDDLRPQLTEPSQITNEIEAWTDHF